MHFGLFGQLKTTVISCIKICKWCLLGQIGWNFQNWFSGSVM